MKKLHYSVDIAATAAAVWHVLLDPVTYAQWTRPFAEDGATLQGTWEEGGTQRFLWRDESGSTGGMIAVVEARREPEFLSLRFTGQVVEGVEDTTSEDAQRIIGAHEDYTLREDGGRTRLTVDVDMDEAYEEWMDEQWPEALGLVKALAEPTGQISSAG